MEETRWGLNSIDLGSLSPTSRPQNPKPQLLTMPRAHSYTTSTSPKFSSPTNSSTVWFRPQATWTSPILLATARTRSTPYRWGRKRKDLPFCSKMGEAQTKEEVISALRSTYRTGEVTWGNFGVGTANATARVEEEWVPTCLRVLGSCSPVSPELWQTRPESRAAISSGCKALRALSNMSSVRSSSWLLMAQATRPASFTVPASST